MRSPLFPQLCHAVTFHLLTFTFAFLSVTNPFALITCFDVRLYNVFVLTFALTLYMYICIFIYTYLRRRSGVADVGILCGNGLFLLLCLAQLLLTPLVCTLVFVALVPKEISFLLRSRYGFISKGTTLRPYL